MVRKHIRVTPDARQGKPSQGKGGKGRNLPQWNAQGILQAHGHFFLASDWKSNSTTSAFLMETTEEYLEKGRANKLKFIVRLADVGFSFFFLSGDYSTYTHVYSHSLVMGPVGLDSSNDGTFSYVPNWVICKVKGDETMGLGLLHTRDCEPVTSSTLQALSLVEKGEPVQVRFTLHAWGTNGSCECKVDVKSTWIPKWHRMDHVAWSVGLFSENHLLEAGLTQNRWETVALRTLTTIDLFYLIMCEDPRE